MNCQHWKPALCDLARGLETDHTREALLHAQTCKQCTTELEEQRELTESLQQAAKLFHTSVEEKVPQDLIEAFRNSNKDKKHHRRVLIFARAAVVALTILGGWIWYRSQPLLDSKDRSTYEHSEASDYDGEFIPLQYADHPVNSLKVVRVQLQSSDLQQLGFPGAPEWEDRAIQADIVVGEDGLPQAIRFVNMDQ